MQNRLPDFHGKRFLVRGSQPIEERFIRNNYVFGQEERKKVLKNPELAATPTAAMTKPYFDQAQGLDDVTKMQYVDIHTWMLFDILLKADKMSMANSLELRVPFLDKKMLDIALQLPSKYRRHQGKHQARSAESGNSAASSQNRQQEKTRFPGAAKRLAEARLSTINRSKPCSKAKMQKSSSIRSTFFNYWKITNPAKRAT